MKPLAVCAIFRDEARYLREWIEFHRLVGAEKFYLYQNRSVDNWHEVLEPYMAEGIVDVIDWPYRMDGCYAATAQVAAYKHCCDRLRGSYQWIAFIDVDEFLFSPLFNTVTEALDTLPPTWGAVAVSWVLFGSSGRLLWEDAPVIERFTWRPHENTPWCRWIKNIVNAEDPGLTIDTPGGHLFQTAWGTYNELGQRVEHQQMDPVHDLLRINHYFTKSNEEFDQRHPKSDSDDRFICVEDRWSTVQAQEVDDRSIQRYLPELRRRLGI